MVRILQYLHTYTHSFSPCNHAPVLIVIRVCYVWQTPRAKSPSKRQLEGNHGGSKPLMRDTCHILKCAGDKSGKEETDFCMDSFFLCFMFVTAIISKTHNGASKVAGQGFTGRLGFRLPTPLSGVWVPTSVCLCWLSLFFVHLNHNYKHGSCGQIGWLLWSTLF